MSGDDEEAGFSFSPDEAHTDDEPASAPPVEYRSAVVEAAVKHLGADVPCLCARCPGAIWTLGDMTGEAVEADGTIAKASEAAPWTLTVFCRPQHKDLTIFEANYQKRRYVTREGTRAIGFCDAYEEELKAWQAKQ
jgi:hypothetical protein